ncbi:MAG: hypothetical protein ABSG25_01455 [Bryobacteraceae bacterium]
MSNGNKYLYNNQGVITEEYSTQTSSGAANAGDIVSLNSNGQIDLSMLPDGIVPETDQIITSEALVAGAFVNFYDNAGVANCRNADNTAFGKEANGFVRQAYAIGQTATVYRVSQDNDQLIGMTPGAKQWLGTAGTRTETYSTTSGNVVQMLGVATSATTMTFNPRDIIVLA